MHLGHGSKGSDPVLVKLRWLTDLFKPRLSRRIELWVFLSILLIEAILLVPSVYRREQELLQHLQALSSARASGLLADNQVRLEEQVLLSELQRILQDRNVLGGALYQTNGKLVGQFGDPPALSFERLALNPNADYLNRGLGRYDAPWAMDMLQNQYVLIIRHDASSVQQELYGFIGRIAVLVLIITAFVTLATLIVLQSLVIKPILSLRNDLLWAGEAVARHRTGDCPRFESEAARCPDELGEVITAFEQMYCQICEAIAQRQQSEARFRALVEQAVDAFFVVDDQGHFRDVNQQACQVMGYTRAELLELSVPEIQEELSLEDYFQLWQQLTPGEPMAVEGTHRRKDGTTFPVEVRLGLIEYNQQRFVLALVRDITERKQVEQAQARLAEIGELAAMIVHEVRNPLTTVLMGLQSFQRLELSERFQTRLQLALEEADRLQRLLNEILLYAKQQRLDLRDLDLNTFIGDLIPTFQAMPEAEGRQVQWVPSLGPVGVKGDRDKLRQVLINLVSNACEAIPAGDRVTCKVNPVPEQGRVTIQVHNGGEPIPAEVIPNLTKPFFTTKTSGNGLGLAITKRIVEAHGGELRIDSAAPLGTTVTISLPLAS